MNDVEIVEDAHFKLSERESIFRVDIEDVQADCLGKIKVVAKNENGQDTKEVFRVASWEQCGKLISCKFIHLALQNVPNWQP